MARCYKDVFADEAAVADRWYAIGTDRRRGHPRSSMAVQGYIKEPSTTTEQVVPKCRVKGGYARPVYP